MSSDAGIILALHGKKERGSAKICFIYITWLVFFLLSVGIYFFVTLFLVAADHLVPDIMDEYNMLMEESGIVGAYIAFIHRYSGNGTAG